MNNMGFVLSRPLCSNLTICATPLLQDNVRIP